MRYFIELAYKGTNYHGWQYQPNALTVQELITNTLGTVLKYKIELVGAGRTDAGVHAEQFFAHIDVTKPILIDEILYKVNAILPDDIVIYNFYEVEDTLHARFDAISRSYEYRIYLGRNPFMLDTAYQLNNTTFDIDKMNEAASWLLHYNNFKCFSRSKSDVKTYNCKVTEASWELVNKNLTFYISADRFLRNMVRAIVGTLLYVGSNKITVEGFKNIIESENRNNAGPSAPAKGLFLTKVLYNENKLNNG